MYSQTTVAEAPSTFDKYQSITAPRSEDRPVIFGTFARHCTAALTLISAFTTFGLDFATAAIPGAATVQHQLPVVIWRSSRAALSQAEIALLMKKLDRLKKYRAGWAGPGSLAATPRALIAAGDFIHYISEAGLPAPNRINLSSDGEINFYWKRHGASLDLGIDRRTRSSFYARFPDGAKLTQDAKVGLPRLDAKLINALM